MSEAHGGSALCPRLRAAEPEQSCARSVEIEYHGYDEELRAH